MSHEGLIVTLASQATPVRPLPAPAVRMARWMLCAMLAVAIGVAWRGIRANWAEALSDPAFVAANVLAALIALTAAWVTLTLAVPGALRSPVARWLPIVGLVMWGAIVILPLVAAGHLASSLMTEHAVAACMWKTYGIAAGPAMVLIGLAQRAAPLEWGWTAGLAALSALAFGVLGTELICPITRAAHLFNWHFLPVALLSMTALGVGVTLNRLKT